MPRTSIVIADSHEIIREGIAARLTESCDIDVVGQAGDGYTTIKVCRQVRPDFLLMDLSLTRPAGIETLLKVRQSLPDTRVVVLSSEATVADAFHTLSRGAVGFMPKQAKGADFVTAIQAAIGGYACVPAEYLAQFVEMRRNVTRTGNAFGLSPREIEILEACASGQRTKEVAERLSISVRTVETHRNSIYRKTECRNLSELSRIVGLST
ncbi:MAG: response regulator transcription factor [Pseudomonadota bacterium]